MDAKLKADWVKALRSGEYRQERNNVGRVEQKLLCCLGVGAVVADPSIILIDTNQAVDELCKHGFTGWDGENYSSVAQHLISLNDNELKSFIEIADYIEQHIPSDEQSEPSHG